MNELLVLDNALDHDFYRPVEHYSASVTGMVERFLAFG